MKKDTTNDMTVGSPVSLIIKFMIPNVPGKSFSSSFIILQIPLLPENLIGVNALAAIGSTGSLIVFCDRLAEWTQQWICDYRSPDVRSEKV